MRRDALLFSIVRVMSGGSLGTGFLLQGGWVITCAHNVKEAERTVLTLCDGNGDFNIPLATRPFHIIVPEEYGDIACFRLDGDLPRHSRPLLLSDCGCSEKNFCRVFGFPTSNKDNGLPYNSATIDSITSRSEAGWRQIILAKAEPVGAGFSGSPLWDAARNALVGMVLQQGDKGLARAIPAEVIAKRLGLPCYELSPYLGIERIDARFLYEQSTNPLANLNAEAFYTADFSAQWWGVLNGLVADKVLFQGLPEQVEEYFDAKSPVVALLEGAGGMGKTTAARRLAVELHERINVFWIEETADEETEEVFTEFVEAQQNEQRRTLVILDDWGKFSDGFRSKLLQVMRKQIRQPDGGTIRFALTARHTDHKQLSQDLLAPNARVSFDGDKNLQADNRALFDKVLKYFDANFTGLVQTMFTPEDRLLGKPFHLLFILLRAAEDSNIRQELGKMTRDAEGKFREVLQYDFDRLYENPDDRGLAVALLFFAYVKVKHKINLGKTAFFELANAYSPNATYPPGERLTALSSTQWGILSHYIYVDNNPSVKHEDAPELIFFKKDEYPETLLNLHLIPEDFLEREKKRMVQMLMDGNCQFSSSHSAHIFCIKERLFSANDQVQIIENLLTLQNGHPLYTLLFLGSKQLPDVDFDRKWDWVNQFNEISPKNQNFHDYFLNSIRERADSFALVKFMIKAGANSSSVFKYFLKHSPANEQVGNAEWIINLSDAPEVYRICMNILVGGSGQVRFAKKMLEKSKDISVILKCLNLLSNDPEVIFFAKKLLEENRHPQVICVCLNLLSSNPEVKIFAKKLLEESNNHQVICVCLNLLSSDPEVKFFAKKLLEESNNHQVICVCLNLLSSDSEVKVYAKRLIEESKSQDVICTCLNLLSRDPEVKVYAKKLLEESNSFEVICTCLNLLSDDPGVKIFAKSLLEESKIPNVLCLCLNLLSSDPEAKIFAKKLLKESKSYEVICTCLNLLSDDPEVKVFAKNLLEESKIPDILCRCLQVLKRQNDFETGASFALSKIEKWNGNQASLIGNCLNYLPEHPKSIALMRSVIQQGYTFGATGFLYRLIIYYGYGQHDFWKQKVRQIIQNWRNESRDLVGSSLRHLEEEPALVKKCCEEIILRWKKELQRLQRRRVEKKQLDISDYYLQKALVHPHLKDLAFTTAKAIYDKELSKPGSITPHLLEQVTNIVQLGIFPEWQTRNTDEMEDMD